MGQELAKGIALSTAWAVDDMDSWSELTSRLIVDDAVDLVGELSHIIGQMAKALGLIEGQNCTPEQVLQQLALDAESSPEG